jgi:hypothetical protein
MKCQGANVEAIDQIEDNGRLKKGRERSRWRRIDQIEAERRLNY